MKALFKFLFTDWLGLTIIFFILASCSFYGFRIYMKVDTLTLKQGTITSKTHYPERSVYLGPSRAPGGAEFKYPERWEIIIEGCDNTGKFKIRKINVTQKEFKSVKVGEFFTMNK